MHWKQYKLVLVFALGATLAVSCVGVTRHPEFNIMNCSKIEKNMTIDQIEAMFGKPDKVEMTICGPEGGRHSCMIYSYEMGYKGKYQGIMNHNTFYFTKTYFVTGIELDDGTIIRPNSPEWRSRGFPDPPVAELPNWSLFTWTLNYIHP